LHTTPLRRRFAVTAAAVAGAAALASIGAGLTTPLASPAAGAVRPDASTLPVEPAERLNPVQGFPGSDSTEAQTAAEQYDQARGLVPPNAYRDAFTSMRALPLAGGAWTESTDVPYDSDDLRYRDPNGNATGGFGIVSGRVVALATAKKTVGGVLVDALYAGAANGGVFESGDDGKSWTPITDDLPSLSVGDIATAPDTSVWLAMGEANTGGTSYAGDGVWRREATGTWTQVGGGSISGTTINKLQFDGDGIVYAATSRGLFRHSTDAAADEAPWEEVLVLNRAALADKQTSNAPYANIINDVITRPGKPNEVLVAAGWRSSTDPSYYGNGFYLSTKGGAVGSFTKIDPQGAINPKEIGNTTFAYAKDGTSLYAVVQSTVLINKGTGTRAANTVLAGVYRSKSGSITGPWSLIADSTKLAQNGSALKQSIGGKGYGPGVQAWYNQSLAVDPTNPEHVYLGLEEVYETFNGGATWSAVSPYWNFYFPCWNVDPAKNTCPSTTHSDQHDAMFAGTKVYVSNDGGVFSRPASGGKVNANGNATDWKSLNANLRSLQYYAASTGVDPAATGTVVLSGGLQDNGGSILRGLDRQGRTSDRGDSTDYPKYAAFPYNSATGDTGVMGSNFGGDGGDLMVDPSNGCKIIQEYVFLSLRATDNCGVSNGVTPATRDIAPLDAAPRFIAPVEADAAQPNHLVAAGNTVWTYANGYAIKNGSDWVRAYDLGTVNGRPNSTTALGSSNDTIYAGYCSQCNNNGFASGLARVEKTSTGWTGKTVAAVGLPNRFLSGVHVDAKDGTHVVVAVNGFSRRFTEGPGSIDGRLDKGHLFESFDGGASFTSVDGDLPDVPADDVILSTDGFTALVATDLGVVRGTRTAVKNGDKPVAFTWSRLGSPVASARNLPAATVMDLSVGPDGVLYAATHSRGIWGYALGNDGGLTSAASFRPAARTTGASPAAIITPALGGTAGTRR